MREGDVRVMKKMRERMRGIIENMRWKISLFRKGNRRRGVESEGTD